MSRAPVPLSSITTMSESQPERRGRPAAPSRRLFPSPQRESCRNAAARSPDHGRSESFPLSVRGLPPSRVGPAGLTAWAAEPARDDPRCRAPKDETVGSPQTSICASRIGRRTGWPAGADGDFRESHRRAPHPVARGVRILAGRRDVLRTAERTDRRTRDWCILGSCGSDTDSLRRWALMRLKPFAGLRKARNLEYTPVIVPAHQIYVVPRVPASTHEGDSRQTAWTHGWRRC